MMSRPAPASAGFPPGVGQDGPPGFEAVAKAVLEDLRDAVFVADPQGAIQWANPAALAVTAGTAAVLVPGPDSAGHVNVHGQLRPAQVRALPGPVKGPKPQV